LPYQKFFEIYEHFTHACDYCENEINVLQLKKEDWDEIHKATLGTMSCLGNSFNPDISETEMKTQIDCAGDYLADATIKYYDFALRAISGQLALISEEFFFAPCLKGITYNDFQNQVQQLKEMFNQARHRNKWGTHPRPFDRISAYRSTIDFGIVLKEKINEPEYHRLGLLRTVQTGPTLPPGMPCWTVANNILVNTADNGSVAAQGETTGNTFTTRDERRK
jgi:hypothetical protein